FGDLGPASYRVHLAFVSDDQRVLYDEPDESIGEFDAYPEWSGPSGVHGTLYALAQSFDADPPFGFASKELTLEDRTPIEILEGAGGQGGASSLETVSAADLTLAPFAGRKLQCSVT